MDGRAYLEKLIKDRRVAGGGHVNPAEIRGVALGLVAAGWLDQADADQIVADLEEWLVRTGRLVRRTFSASATSTRLHAVARPAGAIDPPAELRGVVPLTGRTLAIGDVTVLLTSLEVWSTALVLRLARPGSGAITEMFRDSRWHAVDDGGAKYEGRIQGYPGLRHWTFAPVTFTPGPAQEASILTVTAELAGTGSTVDRTSRAAVPTSASYAQKKVRPIMMRRTASIVRGLTARAAVA